VNNETGKQIRLSLDLASKIAKTLGDLDYQSAKGVDVKAITDTFVRFGKAACDIEQRIATEVLTKGKTQETTVVMGQIVIDMKTCTQSIAWGIRSGFLSGKPAESSLYSSIQNDEQAVKRLDDLWTALTELSIFFDEGGKASPQPSAGEIFKFELSELRDKLAKFSETLSKI
jgi:hypothetical protein